MKLQETMPGLRTLDDVGIGESAAIAAIEGGWVVRQRLNQMGFHVHDEVQVRRCCSMGGPMLVRIHGMDVALGRNLAGKIIMVRVE
jgi:ferrous iron transport protein A